MTDWNILQGNALDVLRTLESDSVQCVITSPPYWGLRDYGTATWHSGESNCEHTTPRSRGDDIRVNDKQGTSVGSRPNTSRKCACGAIRVDDQLGLEPTPEQYVNALADIFNEVFRVLRMDGTLWLNLGDSYISAPIGHKSTKSVFNSSTIGIKIHDDVLQGAKFDKTKIPGFKQKDLVGIPWMVAFELRKRGWWLRQDIIWNKPNPMPESVTDRCTKAHEYIFLLTKSQRYYFDHEAIQEEANYDGRKNTMFKGGVKYDDQPIVPGTQANTFHSQGRERWQKKPVFGNRDGQLDGLHSGNEWNPQVKNRQQAFGGHPPTNLKRCGDSGKGRDRSMPRNRNGITGSLDHKNVQYDGQEPNSFHLSRADGEPDEIYYVRNKRSVWTVNSKPFRESHFATFPEKLIEPMVLAGTKEGDLILDPFSGAATTGLVALKHKRRYIGIELNPKYIEISQKRLAEVQVKLFT